MTLSKRNSRTITVGEVVFRWAIAARSQADTESVTLIVQPPDNGQQLSVDIPCRDPYLNIQEPSPVVDVRGITPGLVRQLIDDARNLEWHPNQAGTQFRVRSVIGTFRNASTEDDDARQVTWQCPTCSAWNSQAIQDSDQAPLMTACHQTQRDFNSEKTNVLLFWKTQ